MGRKKSKFGQGLVLSTIQHWFQFFFVASIYHVVIEFICDNNKKKKKKWEPRDKAIQHNHNTTKVAVLTRILRN